MEESKIVFVGRLQKDTGILEFLKWLKIKNKRAVFVGDGDLRNECEKYGKACGFTDPKPFLKKAKLCVPGGYLTYIEAKKIGCKTMVFPNNPLKRDYWNEIQKVEKFPSWKQIAEEYLKLWGKK